MFRRIREIRQSGEFVCRENRRLWWIWWMDEDKGAEWGWQGDWAIYGMRRQQMPIDETESCEFVVSCQSHIFKWACACVCVCECVWEKRENDKAQRKAFGDYEWKLWYCPSSTLIVFSPIIISGELNNWAEYSKQK